MADETLFLSPFSPICSEINSLNLISTSWTYSYTKTETA